MVVLPPRPRRAWLRSFGVAAGLWAGLAVLLLAPFDLPGRLAAAVLVLLLGGVAPIARPAGSARVYRLWNRIARGYARLARAALLAVCYGVVALVGVAGTALRLRRPEPGESLWLARDTLATEAYGSQHDRPGKAWHGRQWAAVLAWAARTGNGWAVFLVPFLALVATLEEDERRDVPVGIYTLF